MRYSASDRAVNRGFEDAVAASGTEGSVDFREGFEASVGSNEVLEALSEPLNQIVVAVKNALEKTPPELGADIAEHGLMLTGGGALLRDLDQLLKEETGLPVHVAEEPLNCVVKGCGIALENMDKLRTAFAVG